MFDGGTKVIAIASSVKKKIGTRKGTIAYIGWPYIFGQKTPVIQLSGKWYIYSISFSAPIIRYGFEETLRHETKLITAIFPYNRDINNENVEKTIDSFINSMNDENFTNNLLKHIKANNKADPKDFGLFVPLKDTTNFDNMGKLEFTAWVDSILLNTNFQQALEENLNNPNRSNILGGTLNYLMDCCYSGDTKKQFFDGLLKDHDYKILMINTIRQLNTFKYLKTLKKDIKMNNNELINQDGIIIERALIGFTINELFSSHHKDNSITAMKKRIDLMHSNGSVNDKQKEKGEKILNRIKIIKDYLYKLA